MFDKIEAIKDSKQEIKFWLDALSNPNINMETVKLLNECLCSELKNYLYPIYKIKTDPMPIDDKMTGYANFNDGVSTMLFK
jgi:hypothetical protein